MIGVETGLKVTFLTFTRGSPASDPARLRGAKLADTTRCTAVSVITPCLRHQ